MDTRQFVKAIRSYAGDIATKSIAEDLKDEPSPGWPDSLRSEARWFSSLTADDQARALAVAARAVDAALFGLFCILDGARSVERSSERGEFRVVYVKGGIVRELSNPQVLLHEIYREIFPFQ